MLIYKQVDIHNRLISERRQIILKLTFDEGAFAFGKIGYIITAWKKSVYYQ